MHELSLAHSIVETASESARQVKAVRVVRVHLRLGALSGIAKDSLRCCYDFSTRDTMLEGSSLEIEDLPAIIHCAICKRDRPLPDIRHFCCPVCGTPSADLRQGKELEIGALEIEVR